LPGTNKNDLKGKKMRCKFYIAIAIVLVTLLTTGNANAQPGIRDFKNSTPDQRAQFQTLMMKRKLNLDAGQLNKVQTINLKYAQKFQPIIKSTGSRLSKLKQAMALQKQKDQELQTVFTKDQYSQYQAFEAQLSSKLSAHLTDSD
jgi:hypothetical protein